MLMSPSLDSYGARATLNAGGRSLTYYSLPYLEGRLGGVARLPYSLRILLENLVRSEDGVTVTRDDIATLAAWDPQNVGENEIAFRPARVLMQDLTGVPAIVDLAAMRDAMVALGGDPRRINPLSPAELVIDHSVQVDEFGTPGAFARNAALELERNRERYGLLRWGQSALANFKVVPPDTGIVHQVNLECLARVVFQDERDGVLMAYPDTVIGTDSHTTMINGLGVLGWGVGGIEAEASLLGQPSPMLIPEVVGFKLTGRLAEGATATDLVLTVTQMLRRRGVVGKFVEFYGPGLSGLPLPDRSTIANMAPEYGATIGFFPVDAETLNYLRFTGRDEAQVQLVEAYCRAQGLFREDSMPEPVFSDTLELDMATVVPSIAGPRRPQDRIPLTESRETWRRDLGSLLQTSAHPDQERYSNWLNEGGSAARPEGAAAGGDADRDPFKTVTVDGGNGYVLGHGAVVIAAITSCTNTSNPQVLMAAGLLARNAVQRGINAKPWVKTSLAPGSQVVTEYLREAGLLTYLEQIGFYVVGYGCTTCIGNSGPLPDAVSNAVDAGDLVVASVLSGNRNFEGRIQSQIKANYLASPPLVVAYALAGSMDCDLNNDPLGMDAEGRPVYLSEIWPSRMEIEEAMRSGIRSQMFRDKYADVFSGDDTWRSLEVPTGDQFAWDPFSTYVRKPPYFDGMTLEIAEPQDVRGARALGVFGDSVTTDHISPAGEIVRQSPSGHYLTENDVPVAEYNTFGARRGNHEVMGRGTFGNIRLRNRLVPGVEGWYTKHLPDGEEMSIWDASQKYQAEGVPLIVLGGKEYGTGSSRDWAAKGPKILGVKAVIVESFERIHRSNLVGMGVLPLQFEGGQNVESLGLTGDEVFDIEGIESAGLAPRQRLKVTATAADGSQKTFNVISRIDTPIEVDYYRHDGILPYVLRQLARS
jgi:aconitate hydratase